MANSLLVGMSSTLSSQQPVDIYSVLLGESGYLVMLERRHRFDRFDVFIG
jgi:hypothetical protein